MEGNFEKEHSRHCQLIENILFKRIKELLKFLIRLYNLERKEARRRLRRLLKELKKAEREAARTKSIWARKRVERLKRMIAEARRGVRRWTQMIIKFKGLRGRYIARGKKLIFGARQEIGRAHV